MSHIILKAARFAADKHRDHRRKGAAAAPYINHTIEVAENLAHHGVTDQEILAAALLHDTIEDTDTTPEEIGAAFGPRVQSLVEECTDDKRLPKEERKRLQIVHAPRKSPGAKQIKIADKISNLRGILEDPPVDWSPQRRLEYFQWAEKVIAGLKGVHPGLDAEAEEVLRKGLASLS